MHTNSPNSVYTEGFLAVCLSGAWMVCRVPRHFTPAHFCECRDAPVYTRHSVAPRFVSKHNEFSTFYLKDSSGALAASWGLLSASWVPPGCLLGVCWVDFCSLPCWDAFTLHFHLQAFPPTLYSPLPNSHNLSPRDSGLLGMCDGPAAWEISTPPLFLDRVNAIGTAV